MLIDGLRSDVRYALRALGRAPGFAAVAIVILGLGIGANAALLSFVDTLFERPLAVPRPEGLVRVYATEHGQGWGTFGYHEYAELRDRATSLSALVAHYSAAPLNLVAGGDSREEQGAVVSGNYFSALGVEPALGRFFRPEEDAVPDRDAVAVLGWELWQRRFGGDPAVLGATVRINGTPFQVIGVAPRGFSGVSSVTPDDLWIPTMMLRAGYRWCDGLAAGSGCRVLSLLGRLAPGHGARQAQAELAALVSHLAAAAGEPAGERGVRVLPARGVEPEARALFGPQMRMLMAVAVVLLLVACANLAGLLLARSLARRTELTVRLALGAGRLRLVRLLVTEAVVLGLAGGLLGLAVAAWAKQLLLLFYATDSEGYRLAFDLGLNPRVLAYALGLSALTGLLFGAAPALHASRQDLTLGLRGGGGSGGPRRGRLHGALVAGQVALALALVVAAGLLVRSAAVVEQGAGFDPHGVALLRLRPRLVGYGPERAQAFHHEVLRRLEELPGVESVSLAKGQGFVWRGGGKVEVRLPGEEGGRGEGGAAGGPAAGGLSVDHQEVGSRFFATLKIPLLQGRDFDERDRPGSPRVAILDEALARRLWPAGSPLGRSVVIEGQPYEVVGVARDASLRSAGEGPLPFLYLPFWQNGLEPQVDARLCVRVAGDPAAMLPVVRRAIAGVDPLVPISEDMTMSRQVEAAYMPVRLASRVLLAAGAMALLLSAVGLYGVLAFAVRQRRREIGIRMAVGALPGQVVALVLRRGLALAAAGIAAGLLLALAATRLLASWLYGVPARDPLTFAAAALLLAAVALFASYLPAHRATQIDPLEVLKSE